MKQSVTIKVGPLLVETIKEHYAPYQIPNNGEYIDFCADYHGNIITIYLSKKANSMKIGIISSGIDTIALFQFFTRYDNEYFVYCDQTNFPY